MKISYKERNSYTFSFLLVFSITYSGYFQFFSIMGYLLILIYLLLNVKKENGFNESLFVIVFIFNALLVAQILFSAVPSINVQVIRLMIVLNALLIISVTDIKMFSVSAFMHVALIHAVIITLISASLSLNAIMTGGEDLWVYLRSILAQLKMGDVWTRDGVYFRAQLFGNPTVFGFCCFVIVFYDDLKRNYGLIVTRTLGITATLGVVSAGNISYVVVIIFAIFARNLKRYQSKLQFLITLSMFLAGPFLFILLVELILVKFSDGAHSGNYRISLVNSYLYGIILDPIRAFVGHGLNTDLPSTYGSQLEGAYYIELQSLLIAFKIGLIPFAFFNYIYFLGVAGFNDPKIVAFLLLYIIGSSVNPYLYDSTQIIITMLAVEARRFNLQRMPS